MAKIKPGTPHPNRKGLVMGKNGRYVAKSTYAKQVKASQPKPARQNVTGQRALPPAGQSGGSKPPRGTRQPGTTRPTVDRRSAAAARARAAAAGTGSSTVRTGGEKAVTTYSKQARDAVRKFVSKNAPKAAQGLGAVARGASRLIAGRDDGSGSALMAAMATNDALNLARGSTAEERNKAKNKPKNKPNSSQSTKSGMTPAQLKAAQDKANADRRAGKLSNIPAPKAKAKPKPQTKKQRAYAADARNKEYDKLRKAGKTKEAEALGKKIAADARKKAPKNPYRVPQGGERKDRLSKQVKELKGMGKKKKQSRANQAGWQGNRNY